MVFNNSSITGLAGQVAAQAQPDRLAGRRLRQLVRHHPGLDGLLPAAARGRGARLLALDLGIQRTAPAVDPMRLDRLTVILTGPLD